MAKTVTYFPLQCALNSGPIISAVMSSLQRRGFEVINSSYNADIAVIWSVLWAGKMLYNKDVYESYRNRNLPVICIEVGALDRGRTWKLALNHVNANGYYGHKQDLDIDRPKKLGLSLSYKNTNYGKILIAGQHNKSLQLKDVNQEAWYVQQIQTMQLTKDCGVVVRPHPRCPMDRTKFPKDVIWEEPKKLNNTYDSFNIHWDFDTVINYNSGPGIQAVIADVPVIVDSSSLAYNVLDREQWFIELCHTEYTVEEIEQGTWIHRLGLEA